MYDQMAICRLKEKIGYELWLLEFLSKTDAIFTGGTNSTEIDCKSTFVHHNVGINISLGQEKSNDILEKLSALTFVSSFKIIDMIVEWILSENNVDTSIITYQDKNNKIYSKNSYPPLFVYNEYIKSYILRLYSRLLMFRHEIVHRYNFSVENKTLKINRLENGKTYTLKLDQKELGYLVRIVVLVSRLLMTNNNIGDKDDCLLKYYFDNVYKCHGLSLFEQKEPIIEDVILKIDKEGDFFPINMKYIKEKLNDIFPNVYVIFNLDIIGRIDNKPFIRWSFSFDELPKEDMILLSINDYKDKIKEYY